MRWECLCMITLSEFAVFSAVVHADTVGDAIGALEARETSFNNLHLRAEWRTYRVPSDKAAGDREHWWRMKPGVDPDYDIEYHIARPSWRLYYFDIVEKKKWPINAWVDGELTQLIQPGSEGGPCSINIFEGKDPNWLRGRVYMTPVELEMFDTKESFLDLLRKAPRETVKIQQGDGSMISVEFQHPANDYVIMRARFDMDRDWVPLFYEQYTPPKKEDTWQPMSYSMETVETMSIGNSYIVSKALIINRNPNVLTDTMVVTDYQVVDAKRDESITADTVRIEIPKKNVRIYDLVRWIDETIDENGKVVQSVSINKEEVIERDRALIRTAAEIEQASVERLERQSYFSWLVGSSAVVAVSGGVVMWFKKRRLAA